MSEDSAAEESADKSCANCGVAEVDDIKLQDCRHCDLAKYCGDDCQQQHREIHEVICKERAARLKILFRQNESSYRGDCPICFLPLPLEENKVGMNSCCGKEICLGCDHANKMRKITERINPQCAFCRKPMPKSRREAKKNNKKRAAANDPMALCQIGAEKIKDGNYHSGVEYYNKAAALGDVTAHWNLATLYMKGIGVEKDAKMEIYHLEEAAIAGHAEARLFLGERELKNMRYERAMKHFIIAANLGDNTSVKLLKDCYRGGLVSKDDLAAALRAHQAAVDATKSPQREAVPAGKKFF